MLIFIEGCFFLCRLSLSVCFSGVGVCRVHSCSVLALAEFSCSVLAINESPFSVSKFLASYCSVLDLRWALFRHVEGMFSSWTVVDVFGADFFVDAFFRWQLSLGSVFGVDACRLHFRSRV